MKNTGDGRRKVRVEMEIQEVISAFIIRQLRHDLPGVVTVTRVVMPADFRTANVYVTYFSGESQAAQDTNTTNLKANAVQDADFDVAEVLQSWSRDIQNEIAHKMKMRYCPKLTFYNDETTSKILKIEKILSEISQKPELKKALDEEDID